MSSEGRNIIGELQDTNFYVKWHGVKSNTKRFRIINRKFGRGVSEFEYPAIVWPKGFYRANSNYNFNVIRFWNKERGKRDESGVSEKMAKLELLETFDIMYSRTALRIRKWENELARVEEDIKVSYSKVCLSKIKFLTWAAIFRI